MSRWIDGLEQAAYDRLPDAVVRYFKTGSRDGLTAAEAESAWRDVRLRPHVLRDVSVVSTETSLLGTPIAAPIALAPTTLQRHADPLGEVAMAAGAAAAKSLVCVSSNAGSTYADIAAAGAPWWLQVYVLRDRGLTEAMLQRAVEAGARALVLTVDTPIVGTRYAAADAEGRTVWDVTPDHYLHANHDVDLESAADHQALEKATDLTPRDISWLAERTNLPVVVKGVLRADDALRAVDAGAAGVWVSNHGGRQLDQVVSTRHAVGDVASAVGGAAQVYVDGGLRRGVDVLSALALGASAVFLGRPGLWALSVDGRSGVTRLLSDLGAELEESMRLAGCASMAEIDRSLVVAPDE